MSQKIKGAKLEQYGFTSYFIEQKDRTSIGDVVGLIRKKKILILLRSLSPTLTLINLVFTSRFMVMMRTIVSQITPGVEIGPILNIKC
jgi:hypothetical protein